MARVETIKYDKTPAQPAGVAFDSPKVKSIHQKYGGVELGQPSASKFQAGRAMDIHQKYGGSEPVTQDYLKAGRIPPESKPVESPAGLSQLQFSDLTPITQAVQAPVQTTPIQPVTEEEIDLRYNKAVEDYNKQLRGLETRQKLQAADSGIYEARGLEDLTQLADQKLELLGNPPSRDSILKEARAEEAGARVASNPEDQNAWLDYMANTHSDSEFIRFQTSPEYARLKMAAILPEVQQQAALRAREQEIIDQYGEGTWATFRTALSNVMTDAKASAAAIGSMMGGRGETNFGAMGTYLTEGPEGLEQRKEEQLGEALDLMQESGLSREAAIRGRKGQELLYNITSVVPDMLVAAGTSYLTGGAGNLARMTGKEMLQEMLEKGLTKNLAKEVVRRSVIRPSSVPLAMKSFGLQYANNMAKGWDEDKAATVALISAYGEGVLEGGGIDDVATKGSMNKAVDLLKSAMGEGFEEVTQNYWQEAVYAALADEEFDTAFPTMEALTGFIAGGGTSVAIAPQAAVQAVRERTQPTVTYPDSAEFVNQTREYQEALQEYEEQQMRAPEAYKTADYSKKELRSAANSMMPDLIQQAKEAGMEQVSSKTIRDGAVNQTLPESLMDQIKQKAFEGKAPLPTPERPVAPTYEATVDTSRMSPGVLNRMQEDMANLTEEQQAGIRDMTLQGMTRSEISQELDIPPRFVRSYMSLNGIPDVKSAQYNQWKSAQVAPTAAARAAEIKAKYGAKQTMAQETDQVLSPQQGQAVIDKTPSLKDMGITAVTDPVIGETYAQQLGKQLGVDVVFFEGGDASVRGIQSNGTVFIKRTEDGQEVMRVLGHEFLHDIKDNHTETYDELRSVLKEGLNTEAVQNALKRFAANPDYQARVAADPDLLVEEILADEAGSIFTDPEFWADVQEQNPNLAQRLVKLIRDFIDRVLNVRKESGNQDVLTETQIRDFRKRFEQAVVDISTGVEAAKEAPSQEGDPKLSVYPRAPFDEWWSDRTYKEQGGRLVNMSPEKFLELAAPLDIDEESRENIDLLKDHIETGGTLDPLTIYERNSSDPRATDGRHRAMAAAELGIDRVPVVDYSNVAKFSIRMQSIERAFSDSKVRDETGSLQEVYHGTSLKGGEPFYEFQRGTRIGMFRRTPIDGFWFTDSQENARTYAGGGITRDLRTGERTELVGSVMPVYLNITNPVEFDTETDSLPEGYSLNQLDQYLMDEVNRTDADGIIIRNRRDPFMSDQFVVFSPEQIKSPVGKDTVDATDPDIRFDVKQPGVKVNMDGRPEGPSPMFGSDWYRRIVDRTVPIGQAAPRAGALAQNASVVSGTVEHIATNSLVDTEGNVVDKSLQEVTAPVIDDAEFWQYMAQLHNIDRAAQGRPVDPSMSPEESQAYTAELEAQNPEYRQYAEDITAWIDTFMREWAVDTGVLDPETYDMWREMYPFYFPTYREFTDLEGGGQYGPGKRFVDLPSVSKKATGSERDITNPVGNIVQMINKVVRTARYNEVGQALFEHIEQNPDNEYAQVIEPGVGMFKTNLDNIVTVWDGGQPQYLQINDQRLLESLKGLPRIINNAKAVRKVTNVYKALITRDNPFFALRNVMRDVPTAYVYGQQDNPLMFLANLAKAGYQVATGTGGAERFRAMGGGGSGQFSADEAAQYAKLLQPSAVGPIRKAWNMTGGGILKGIRFLNEVTELAPRVSEFNYVLEQTGDVREALRAAQSVTVDFARGGDITKQAEPFVPYLNASVQGIDRFFQAFNFRQDPQGAIKRMIKSGVAITAPQLASYMISMAQKPDEYEQLSQRTKDNYYVFPKADGPGFWRIPKSRELSVVFGSLLERVLTGNFEGFGGTVATNFSPVSPFTNNIAAPLVYNLPMNEDWAGRPIVPGTLQGLSPGLQYDANTSEVGKWLGEKTNLSPKQLDYVIDSYTGVIGDFLLPATTKRSGAGATARRMTVGAFEADPAFSSQVVTDFYNNKEEAEKTKNDKNLRENIPSRVLTHEERIYNEMNRIAGEVTTASKYIANNLQTDDPQVREIKQVINKHLARANKTDDPVKLRQISRELKAELYNEGVRE